MTQFGPLTLRCHICGRERSTDEIRFRSADGESPEQVRYCSDSLACIEAARNFRFEPFTVPSQSPALQKR